MLETLHLLRPWWLLGFIPVLVLTIGWARSRLGESRWEGTITPELLAVLLEPGHRNRSKPLAWGVAITLALVTLGLAGPAWERLPQPVEQKRDAMVILLDLSLSMFAEDVSPSRIIRARQKVTDMLRRRDEGFTALIAYAGDAHTVAPLTDDVHTIENLLGSLSPEMMPVLGSNVGSAMEETEQLFSNAGINQGRILLVTDGVDDARGVTRYANANFPVSILGVGTPAGAPIPLDFVNQPGQVLRTDAGEVIVPKLDEQRLREIAQRGHGRYQRLSLGDDDIIQLTAMSLPGDDETVEVDREFDTWTDRGYLVCLLALPLLLLAFRRGVLVLLAIAIVPPPAHAGVWDDLWSRRDQQAHAVLQDGRPEVAAELFKDRGWRSVAEYKSGAYQAAAEGFAGIPGTDGHYNRGNALAKGGDLRGAIEAYDQTLAIAPDHADAAFNRDLVKKLLEEQQSEDQDNSQSHEGDQPQDQNSDSPQGTDPDDSQDSEDPNAEDPNTGDPDQPQPDEPDGESEQPQSDDEGKLSEDAEDQQSRDEKQEALEQWLRRVPDDPGGLLRRKFQYDTNQRLRRGDYRNRETEKYW